MIGDNIKKLRERLGLNRTELAAKLGVRQSTVSLWESQNRAPNKTTRPKLCAFFGVTEGELFGQLKELSVSPTSQQIPSQSHRKKLNIVGFVNASGIVAQDMNKDIAPPKSFDVDTCDGVVVDGSSMEGFARDGDTIVYCRTASVSSGDLAYIRLKNNGGEYFKRLFYLDENLYKNFSRAFSKRLRDFYAANPMRRDEIVMLVPLNTYSYTPLFVTVDDIEEVHKVVGMILR